MNLSRSIRFFETWWLIAIATPAWACDTPASIRNNRVTLSANLGVVAAGQHAVKIWRIDDNVVLEKIEVVPVDTDGN